MTVDPTTAHPPRVTCLTERTARGERGQGKMSDEIEGSGSCRDQKSLDGSDSQYPTSQRSCGGEGETEQEEVRPAKPR
jgi:hypothetical protein